MGNYNTPYPCIIVTELVIRINSNDSGRHQENELVLPQVPGRRPPHRRDHEPGLRRRQVPEAGPDLPHLPGHEPLRPPSPAPQDLHRRSQEAVRAVRGRLELEQPVRLFAEHRRVQEITTGAAQIHSRKHRQRNQESLVEDTVELYCHSQKCTRAGILTLI